MADQQAESQPDKSTVQVATPVPWPYWPPPQQPRRRWGMPLVFLAGLLVFGMMTFFSVALMYSLTSRSDYYSTRTVREGEPKQTVALVPVSGVIDSSMAAFIVRLMDELSADGDVAAVVLRVESPGGTVAASDQINRAISRFREQTGRPVIVSQGGYATSGGYYISVAGDYIFAEPTTWTGNIGVILTTFTARKGLEEKLGVTPIVLTSSSTPFKDAGSIFSEMSDEQRQYLQGLIDSAYDGFVDAVLAGRPKLSRQRVVELANGKVYTADQARNTGLVDEIGYLVEAFDFAARRANLSSPNIVMYRPRGGGMLDLLMADSAVSDKLMQDPVQRVEGLLAPQALYLFSNHGLVQGWPTMNYSD